MATFLDIAFLEKFSSVFTFLLILAVLAGIFMLVKAFNDNKALQFFIAAIIALLVSLSPVAVGMISYITPWFVVMFFFIIFILIAFKMFGVSDANITETIRRGLGIQWAVFIVGLIILLAAFSANLGKAAFPYLEEGENKTIIVDGEEVSVATGDIGKNVAATLFHPKVLGMLAVMLIAVAAVGLLGGKRVSAL